MPVKLISIAGARPNFMKLAPLLRELAADADFQSVLVHTGQHYDDNMSGSFFRELGMPAPAYHLQVGSGSHAQQTAEIMKRFEPVAIEERPDAVLVVGDVNSTMACALVAKKLLIPVIHLEAGLRSFDRTMPEEINRIVTDAIADLLLVTEESGRRHLLTEGIPDERIHLVGNLMIDSLRAHAGRALESDILKRLSLEGQPYGLITLHRPSNVDDPAQFRQILDALTVVSRDLPLYFPVHPRTRARLEHMDLPPDHQIRLLEPLGYLDFLCMMVKSRAVFTDSGGIQEETTALSIPCLTLRENTERPVTTEEGTNRLAGTTTAGILAAWEETRRNPKSGKLPRFWDGEAAGRCRGVLRDFFVDRIAREAQSEAVTRES